jgi:hypothetical protein
MTAVADSATRATEQLRATLQQPYANQEATMATLSPADRAVVEEWQRNESMPEPIDRRALRCGQICLALGAVLALMVTTIVLTEAGKTRGQVIAGKVLGGISIAASVALAVFFCCWGRQNAQAARRRREVQTQAQQIWARANSRPQPIDQGVQPAPGSGLPQPIVNELASLWSQVGRATEQYINMTNEQLAALPLEEQQRVLLRHSWVEPPVQPGEQPGPRLVLRSRIEELLAFDRVEC